MVALGSRAEVDEEEAQLRRASVLSLSERTGRTRRDAEQGH